MGASTILAYLWPALLPGLIIGIYYYYKNAFSYWRKRGVKGPEPWIVVGNMAHVIFKRALCSQWMQKYGKVYGIYEGNKPALVVADPQVLRQICIKDFSLMPNHQTQEFMNELQRSFLFAVQDEQWRKQRTLMSGTFTSGKMRRMYKLLEICAEDMLLAFREQLDSGKPIVHLKDLFSLFTMDAIASCCYGLKMERYKSFEGGLKKAATRDDFVKQAMKIFDFQVWRLLAMLIINGRILKAMNFNFISNSTLFGFSAKIEALIRKRRESGKHYDDYLQTLLDAKLDDNADHAPDDNSLDVKESHHLGENDSENNLKFSEEDKLKLGRDSSKMEEIEILAGAMFLLIVGLETTATLLTNCVYALSYHPEIQEKLYESVKSIARFDETKKYSFDYETLISSQYLDAVVSETLRYLTPALQTDRVASEDYYLESHNIHLEKGSKLIVHLAEIMNDKDYWPNPEKFDPERFMPGQREKIVPGSYCPFGIGPRHCLGMRFSLTESKLALAKLVMEFKFEPAPGLSFPPVMKLNFGLSGIRRPEVRVIRRVTS